MTLCHPCHQELQSVTGSIVEWIQVKVESDDYAIESDQRPPYVVRRRSVKENRENEHVAFLRDEYAELESELRDGVADELNLDTGEVRLIDLREALVELGNRHQEELAEILEEWGYEHLK